MAQKKKAPAKRTKKQHTPDYYPVQRKIPLGVDGSLLTGTCVGHAGNLLSIASCILASWRWLRLNDGFLGHWDILWLLNRQILHLLSENEIFISFISLKTSSGWMSIKSEISFRSFEPSIHLLQIQRLLYSSLSLPLFEVGIWLGTMTRNGFFFI